MKDGGSVFPVYGEGRFGETGEFSSGVECENQGISIRDYFAGQALNQATKAAWSEYGQGEFDDYEKIFTRAAEIAYETADAMLAEREKKNA